MGVKRCLGRSERVKNGKSFKKMENKQKKENLKKIKKVQVFRKMEKELKKKIWKWKKSFKEEPKRWKKKGWKKAKKNQKNWEKGVKNGKTFSWFKHYFLKYEKGKRIEEKMQILKILQKSVAYFEAVFVFLTFSPDFLEKAKKRIERDFHGLHMKVFWKIKFKKFEKVF